MIHMIQRLKDLLTYISYKDNKESKQFYIPTVAELEQQNVPANQKSQVSKKNLDNSKNIRKPIPVSEFNRKKSLKEAPGNQDSISTNIDENIRILEHKFNAPANKDIVIRQFTLADKHTAFIAYIDGMVNNMVINNSILRPLLQLEESTTDGCELDYLLESALETIQAKKITLYSEVVYEILTGNTLLYVNGCDFYISNATKGFAGRGVEKPQTEGVITGAQEAFNENIRTNITLVRKIIKNESLTTEFIKIGKRNHTQVAIMYLRDLANPAIIDEVKRRITSLDVDYVPSAGILEQLIEDNQFSILPTILSTERPDRTSAHIIEGKVAVVCEGVPFAKIVPVTINDLLQSPEDSFMRWPLGTAIRFVRTLGVILAVLLPGMFVAITNFHHEMIPAELLIAIARAKENVPFPTVVEIILMEISFELIREAGIRVPGIVGNTLGIIGALILGQAAVQANIVSPILVIIVAITGLGNFAVPNFNLALSIRLLRFAFIIFGALLGFYGISCLLALLGIYFVSLKSFGVPYFSPIVPRTEMGDDLIVRGTASDQEFRPDYLNTLNPKRQGKISRKWTLERPNYSYDKEEDSD